jgi:uncharacterized cupredoxin-like copper-binding protein
MALSSPASGAQTSSERTIVIHHSRFAPGTITVRAGTPVAFTLRNDDPIEHEWIVGTDEVHQRHRLGTEPVHDQVPTEMTVPALTTRLTVVTFDRPGDYAFICHLPGHEAYGMKGTVRVLAE